MKKIIYLLSVIFVVLCLPCNGQKDSVKWVPVLDGGFTGLNIQYIGGSQPFEVTPINALAFGASYQKINMLTNNIDLAFGLYLLEGIKWGVTSNANLGLSANVGLFNNVLTPGIGWYAGQKLPCAMLNISIIPLINAIQSGKL